MALVYSSGGEENAQMHLAAQLSQLSLDRSSADLGSGDQGHHQDGDFAFGPSSSRGGASEPDSSQVQDTLLDNYLHSQGVSNQVVGKNDVNTVEGTKGQICFDFTKGLCTRGDKCKYSHDLATIVHFNSKEKGICFDYLRNQCHRGLLCRFSHDLSNIAQQCQMMHGSAAARGRTNAICYDFVKGVCQRGNECRYSHDLSLIARTARGGAHSARSGEVCYDYLRGRCNRGTSCKYSHNISFLAAPGFMPGDDGSNGGAGPDQMPLLMPGAALLNPALSADPAALSAMAAAAAAQNAPKLMQHLMGSSSDDRRSLAPALSAELTNDTLGTLDQPSGGMWNASSQAAMLNSFAAQQRLAGMAGMGYPPLHQAALAQQMVNAGPAAAAVAAAAAAAAHQQSQKMMAAKTAAAAAAAAVTQQQHAAAMRAAMMAAAQPQLAAAAHHAAQAQLSMMGQGMQGMSASNSGGMPQQMGSSGGAPPSAAAAAAAGLTPEAINALISNLRSDPSNPAMAEAFSGLAAQAHHARMMAGAAQAPQGQQQQQAHAQAAQAHAHQAAQQQQQAQQRMQAAHAQPQQSAPQAIPGRQDIEHPYADQYSSSCSQPQAYGQSQAQGFVGSAPHAPMSEAPVVMRSAAASSGGHASGGGAPPVKGMDPSQLTPNLLPLLKEIWNK